MRAPVSIAQTLNVYLAFRAALRAVRSFKQQRPGSIKSVACPGMGTGTGEMPVGICAKQMREAWNEVEGGQEFRPSGVNDALVQHYRLLRQE
jgi:O-acetyl-ADP-ribose deacetylase (regulator of RNase III)